MVDANLVPFGHPSVLSSSSVSILETKGYKVAVLGIHTLYGDPQESELDALFEYMRLVSELQIIYVHWGDEYSNLPNQRQQKLAELLVQKGADLIIGHHPHVVQSVAVINSVPVFYSLGNFVFDQYFSKETQHGLILTLNTETNQIQIVPTETATTKIQPKLESESEAAATLHALSLISDEVLATYIKAGVVPLRVATSPEKDIMSI
jgi:poly-gamma-glutamate capsule biosynthesis protein CapA/YwtB (metallophosphatase superfamily)